MLRLFIITDDNVFELAYHERFMKMTEFRFENLIRNKSFDYEELLATCGVTTSSERTSPHKYDFESHPMIENYSFGSCKFKKHSFFAKTNKSDRKEREKKKQFNVNKQTSERALFSMFCSVLNTFNYKNSRYILFSVQIYRIFQPVYGNLCSLFL